MEPLMFCPAGRELNLISRFCGKRRRVMFEKFPSNFIEPPRSSLLSNAGREEQTTGTVPDRKERDAKIEKKIQILIVEDELLVAENIREVLQASSYKVV